MTDTTQIGDGDKPIAKRIARGGVWVFLNRVLVALTQLVTLGVLVRLLTPEEMGVYFLISNFVIIGSVFVQMGLPQVAIRNIAESLEVGAVEDTRSVILSCMFLGFLAALFFSSLLLFGLGDWIANVVFDSPLMGQVMIFGVLWLVVQSFQRIVGESFRGLHDMRFAAIFGGMFSGVVSTVSLLFIYSLYGDCSLELAVLVFLGSMLLSFVVAIFLLNKRVRLFSSSSPLQLKSTFTIAFPILFATLGNIILTRADIWLVGMYVDEQQVALYGSAARLVGLLSTPLLMAAAVLAPMIVQLNKQGDMKRLQQVVQLVPTLVAIPAFVVIAGIVLWGDVLLRLIYGDEFYVGSWSVLNLLAFGQVACLVAGVSIQILLMTNGRFWVMGTTLFSALLAIVISTLTIDAHGIEGVAAGFAIGLGVQSLLCIVICKCKLGINTFISLSQLINAKNTLKAIREQNRSRRLQVAS